MKDARAAQKKRQDVTSLLIPHRAGLKEGKDGKVGWLLPFAQGNT